MTDHPDNTLAETQQLLVSIAAVRQAIELGSGDFSDPERSEVIGILAYAAREIDADNAQGLDVFSAQLHPRSGFGERLADSPKTGKGMGEIWGAVSRIDRWRKNRGDP